MRNQTPCERAKRIISRHGLIVGYQVCYSFSFLKAIGAAMDYDTCRRSGFLDAVGVGPDGLYARVTWDDEPERGSQLVALSAIARCGATAACDWVEV